MIVFAKFFDVSSANTLHYAFLVFCINSDLATILEIYLFMRKNRTVS